MKIRQVGLILVSSLVALTNAPSVSGQDWEAADVATVRLKPSAFKTLPVTVREYLDQRRCTIPQSESDPAPHNIVRGRFTSSTATDIAVLCSVDRVSTVLVFRGGNTSDVSELARRPDRGYLQGMGGGRIGYSRALAMAEPGMIRELHATYGGPQLPPLDHDGINDAFVDKASAIWYWYRGKWLALQGAD